MTWVSTTKLIKSIMDKKRFMFILLPVFRENFCLLQIEAVDIYYSTLRFNAYPHVWWSKTWAPGVLISSQCGIFLPEDTFALDKWLNRFQWPSDETGMPAGFLTADEMG